METINNYLDFISKVGTIFMLVVAPVAYHAIKGVVEKVTKKNWDHIDTEINSLRGWVKKELMSQEFSIEEATEKIRILETAIRLMDERSVYVGEKITSLVVLIEKMNDKIDRVNENYIKILEKK